MSEPPDARRLLAMAERAAGDGDLSAADELLRRAAQIQEAALGPHNPDLISTLNNLAVVAERMGRPGDAETFYRRTAALAAASLPPDDPVVAESRQNLENFCRERGLQIVEAAPPPPSSVELPSSVRGTDAGVSEEVKPPPSDLSLRGLRGQAPEAPQPLPPAARRSSRHLEWAAMGAIVLVIVAVLARRSWSPETSSAPTAKQATEPAPTAPVLPPQATLEQAQPPTTIVPEPDAGPVVADKPPAPAPARSPGAISLASVELCRTLSTSGNTWRCDPAGDLVGPGPMVFYTRVRSPRDTTIVHRWYREDTLRQAVKLTIRASASEGYRTYSRQTVDVGDWRVEASSAGGSVLHEQRFTVR